jgi:hypothetical protein
MLLTIQRSAKIFTAKTSATIENIVPKKIRRKYIRSRMSTISAHYMTDRRTRQSFINENIGAGNVVDSFIVDRGHPDGAEIHDVTDTAVILIYNQNSHKFITSLIARPEQIRRLYRAVGKEVPKKILSLAYKHNIKRYNEI